MPTKFSKLSEKIGKGKTAAPTPPKPKVVTKTGLEFYPISHWVNGETHAVIEGNTYTTLNHLPR